MIKVLYFPFEIIALVVFVLLWLGIYLGEVALGKLVIAVVNL